MERNPHLLIEGCAISCYAIGAKVAYIYIRGEFYHVQEILEAEIEKAYKAGYIGRNILGSGFDCDVFVHRGAGAYEAGEETALIESLEGKRAQPRIKPPFPAVAGLYQCPTAVNNVETLCNVPPIVLNGPEWFASLGPEKNGGPKLFCISGHVKRPGVYEASMHTTLRELDLRRGVRRRHDRRAPLQGAHPGRIVGAAAPRQGSATRRRASITSRRRVAPRFGGTDRAERHRLHGVARDEPAPLLSSRIVRQVHAVPRGMRLAAQAADAHGARAKGRRRTSTCCSACSNNILGKTLCAFGDAAATPVPDDDEAVQGRVRGARARRRVHASPPKWRAQAAGVRGASLRAGAHERSQLPHRQLPTPKASDGDLGSWELDVGD